MPLSYMYFVFLKIERSGKIVFYTRAPDAGAWGPPVLRGECEEVFVFEFERYTRIAYHYYYIPSGHDVRPSVLR